MIRKHSILALALLVIMGLASLPAIQGTGAEVSNDSGQQVTTVAFDVAEDMSRFVYDKDVAHEDGMPAHGSTFITQGYIYPAGTLNGSNGVLADGSPEFPELVIGTWACRGWFVGDGAHASTGPMVLTTQHYVFGEDLGAATFVSEGYELSDVGVPILRAVTGGTGPFSSIEGEVELQFLGFNASEGVNQQLVAKLVGVEGDPAEYLVPIAGASVASEDNVHAQFIRED